MSITLIYYQKIPMQRALFLSPFDGRQGTEILSELLAVTQLVDGKVQLEPGSLTPRLYH